MTGFDIANVLLRLLLTALVIYKLSQFREMANLVERIGLGMMGGGSFLTVPIIMDRNHSPFDGWATTVLTLGVVLLIGGRTYRDWKHARANEAAVEQARGHLQARGRL